MLFAYYVHHLNPFVIEFGHGWGVRWYGFAYLMGFVAGIALYRRLARQGYSDLKPDAVADFIVGEAIFGVRVAEADLKRSHATIAEAEALIAVAEKKPALPQGAACFH